MSLSVTFWGTRGTIPTPGTSTVRYGGNTACVSLRDGEGRTVILDAGTGIRGCGRSLGTARPGRLDLLLSHVHWDHIQGLPFFAPMYAERQEIHIHGPGPVGTSLTAVLDRQVDPAVYPVPRTARPAQVSVRQIDAGVTVEIPGFEVRTFPLSHPGGALGYRVTPDRGGPSVAYLTDNELGAGGAARVPAGWQENLVEFIGGASLLIHDAMYTPALLAERQGWGHSSAEEAVALAAAARVGHLVLFHHEPDHDDAKLDALLDAARAAAPGSLTVTAAQEGLTVTL